MPDSQLLRTFNYIKANFSAQVFKGEMRNDKYSLNQKNTGRPYCNIVKLIRVTFKLSTSQHVQ